MVHDRRVNGEADVFGNQGALFMNAMTWWDKRTGSVWSQVWGQAIAGPLKGTTLDLIPASIVPWGTWKAEHADTLAMTNDKGGLFARKERPRDGWVIRFPLNVSSPRWGYIRERWRHILFSRGLVGIHSFSFSFRPAKSDRTPS